MPDVARPDIEREVQICLKGYQRSRFRRLYFVAGLTSFVVGIIGIVVPLLPTAPFIILAAFCFSKSSLVFYTWLLRHEVFGTSVRQWQLHQVISLKAKILGTSMAVLSLGTSFYFFDIPLYARLMASVTVATVFSFIWTRPSVVPLASVEASSTEASQTSGVFDPNTV